MSAAPNGQSKAAEENPDAVENAKTTATRRANKTAAPANVDQDGKEAGSDKPATQTEPAESDKSAAKGTAKLSEDKGAAPADSVSKPRSKRAATVTANPESVSKPGDEQQPAESDSSTPSGVAREDNDPEKEGEARFNPAPNVPGPNDAIPEGRVQVTRKAKEGEHSDPAGNVTLQEDFSAKAKKDFEDIDREKLPVSVTVGQVSITIEEYAGRAVASFSLVGWVGDAPFKILAKDIETELEGALKALRSALA